MTTYEIGGCPSCGAAGASVIADRDVIRDEVEQLWAFQLRRLRPDTPPERLHDRLVFSQDPPLRIVRCTSCTLLYRNPRERPDRVAEAYRDERTDARTLETLRANQLPSYRAQARRLTHIVGRAGDGLEVGSYVGAFLDAAAELGWNFHGVDVNPVAADFTRRNGHVVHTGEIDSVEAPATYDVVAFWNCFDQLADPLEAARAAHRRLTHNGLIAIRVPNGDFYARWQPRLRSPLRPLARTLLAHNNLLGFPYRHGFSPASLAHLLARAGFRIEHTLGDALVPLADALTRSWAAVEERLVKKLLRRLTAARAPWFEVYARKTP